MPPKIVEPTPIIEAHPVTHNVETPTVTAPVTVVPPGAVVPPALTATGTPIVTAPVTVIAPTTTTTDTGGGTSVGHNVDAGNYIGRDQMHRRDDIQYGSSGSSVTFNNPDNARIWVALMNQMQSLSDVAVKLDDLPNIVNKLIEKVNVLERLQIAVKVEPVITPLGFSIPMWVRVSIAVLITLVVFSVIGVLWLVARGV